MAASTPGAAAQHGLFHQEIWIGRSGLSFGVERVLFQERSPYQEVAVLQTDAFGRLLTLDGVVMLSEHDEFVYHEMIAHPALAVLGDPKRVLIVGGGDGGTAREVLRHGSVESLDLVEIDGLVVEAAKRFFPHLSSSFADPRLQLHLADGVAFVKAAAAETYDLIIVDSTDPIGIGEGLFTRDFYAACAAALKGHGLLVVQSESPFDPTQAHVVREVRALFETLLPCARTYLACIPTYPLGLWSFTVGAKTPTTLEEPAGEPLPFADALRYYTPAVHRAAFALPAFVTRLLERRG
jgi:spermidine synthase